MQSARRKNTKKKQTRKKEILKETFRKARFVNTHKNYSLLLVHSYFSSFRASRSLYDKKHTKRRAYAHSGSFENNANGFMIRKKRCTRLFIELQWKPSAMIQLRRIQIGYVDDFHSYFLDLIRLETKTLDRKYQNWMKKKCNIKSAFEDCTVLDSCSFFSLLHQSSFTSKTIFSARITTRWNLMFFASGRIFSALP